jgi:hypothetical protein
MSEMMSTKTDSQLAEVLRYVLVSPNVADANGEPANLVDAVDHVATAIQSGLKWLGTGDAATTMGAIEFHAVTIKDGLDSVASAINNLADAIRERG